MVLCVPKRCKCLDDNGQHLLSAPTRFVRIDFSAGTFFNEKLYDELNVACVNSIKTFWANRVILVKFGRKYSYNLFKNLKKINKTLQILKYVI